MIKKIIGSQVLDVPFILLSIWDKIDISKNNDLSIVFFWGFNWDNILSFMLEFLHQINLARGR